MEKENMPTKTEGAKTEGERQRQHELKMFELQCKENEKQRHHEFKMHLRRAITGAVKP